MATPIPSDTPLYSIAALVTIGAVQQSCSSTKDAQMVDKASLDQSCLEKPWIVVVGASAGGLEALQRFFAVVAAPTQAAFVVIQHLAPDHRSMMADL